jgi:hypothetical protein
VGMTTLRNPSMKSWTIKIMVMALLFYIVVWHSRRSAE